MRWRLRRVFYVALICGVVAVALLGGLRLWAEGRYRGRVYDRLEDVPPRPVAIVLGAGLWPGGTITPVLADRVATAADLYHAGAVQTLLFSGARHPGHDEPGVMLDYAIQLGVPEEAVVLDPGGFRTYDTCRRAREVFGVERAVVVTQRFHAARTLYLCDAVGVDAVAVTADRRNYTLRRVVWKTREHLALVRAWWDVNLGF
jgi:vancomycin permeability regulator SanA